MNTELIGYTGRFQPFHNHHLELVCYALGRARRVAIGVTNSDSADFRRHASSAHRHLPSANPFTYEERVAMIVAALGAAAVCADRYEISPFPLESPAAWPALLAPGTPQLVRVFSSWEREKVRRFDAAGYPAIVLEGDHATRISGSDIRRCLACGEPWEQWVPPGARELVRHGSWRIRDAFEHRPGSAHGG